MTATLLPGGYTLQPGCPVPGLAFAREGCARESYAIVHVHGADVTPVILDLAGRANLELAAEALGELGVNWTLNAGRIANAADLLCYVVAGVERIAATHGGVTLGPAAVYA